MNNLVQISVLFDIKLGVNMELVHLEQCKGNDVDSISFVSRTEKNNGVSAYVYNVIGVEPNPAHTLSVAGGGSVLATFYQPSPYYSGRDLYVLVPKRKMSVIEMLFYAHCISKNKYKYSYGRQANKTLKEILIPFEISEKLRLPLNEFANLKFGQTSKKAYSERNFDINLGEWQFFKLSELFSIVGSKTTSIIDLEIYGKGNKPYVTTQATNNGIENFYDFSTEEGNVLTIDSAVLGYCAYQALNFAASDHVEKLIPTFEMNKYIALFLVAIMNLERYRYNYGRKCSQERMKQISIKLPSKDGKPDFLFMENYIKSLPYSSSL